MTDITAGSVMLQHVSPLFSVPYLLYISSSFFFHHLLPLPLSFLCLSPLTLPPHGAVERMSASLLPVAP